jgi:hypothetical protein
MVLKHQPSPAFILLVSIKLYQGTSFRQSHGRLKIASCSFSMMGMFVSASAFGDLSLWSRVPEKFIVALLVNKFFTWYVS